MEMTAREKSRKPKSRFPTLPTALGNPQEQRIPTFTTATAAAIVPGAAVHTQPHSNNNIPRWARINRRNGPKEVAKLTCVQRRVVWGSFTSHTFWLGLLLWFLLAVLVPGGKTSNPTEMQRS